MNSLHLLAALVLMASALVRPPEAGASAVATGSVATGSVATGAVATGAVASAAIPPAPAWSSPHASNQLLVKLTPGSRPDTLPGGAQVIREIPELGLALVEVPAVAGLAQAAADLSDAGRVEWAEPNYTISPDTLPDDPSYVPQQKPYLDRIGAEAVWDVTEGRPEIIIAVLDTGVDKGYYTNDSGHEDLTGAVWTNPGEIPGNGIDDEGNGFVDDVHGWDFAAGDNNPDDDYGHGTHVAGIAAARIDNGKGIAGIAGWATIMPVDVFDHGIGTYEALIRAIIYATDNGARVINMSLGASSYSLGEEAAVNYAYEHGVVVVAAAGNTGLEERHYPAAHNHAIAVASTNADDSISSFSTRGDWVDVAAPGSGIYSTFPGNRYGSLSGTSMATPHVAGVAALILSRNPDLTPDEVRVIIESTADDLGTPGRDISFGAGRINAARALAGTTPGNAPGPVPVPGPGLNVDLPGCAELLANGGFEGGVAGWQGAGDVAVVSSPASKGQASLHFIGGANAKGSLGQTLVIPGDAKAALLRFDYRIEQKDSGQGTSPDWPFDDWFTADWRSADGGLVGRLLLTGNTADTVSAGLEWDHYIFRLEASDLDKLRAAGPLSLVFTSQNDADTFPTDIWLDAVSLCTASPKRYYLPFVLQP